MAAWRLVRGAAARHAGLWWRQCEVWHSREQYRTLLHAAQCFVATAPHAAHSLIASCARGVDGRAHDEEETIRDGAPCVLEVLLRIIQYSEDQGGGRGGEGGRA
jgi:hypothetical protein